MSETTTETAQERAERRRQEILHFNAKVVNAVNAKCNASCCEDEFSDAVNEVADNCISGQWVDNGIGSYEFWGMRGVHHSVEFELDEAGGDVTVEWSEISDGDLPAIETKPRCSVCVNEADFDVVGTLSSCSFELQVVEVEVDGRKAKRDIWVIEANYSWEVE